MELVRIVFEKGIELRRNEHANWVFQSTREKHVAMEPNRVPQEYSVHPVLETHSPSFGKEITSLLPAKNMHRLSVEISEMENKIFLKDVSFLHAQNLMYILGSLCYHCEGLAESYCDITRSIAEFPCVANESSKAVFGNQPKPFYEFEALVTVARRSYSTMGYIIWNAFGTKKGDTPNNFEKTIRSCRENLPVTLSNRLNLSLSQFVSKVKDYRDCIQHFNPIVNWSPYAKVEKLPNGVWSTSVLIPDNPDGKSPKKFRYDSQLDALTYGWKLTTEIFEVAWAIINQLPDKEAQQKGGETV